MTEEVSVADGCVHLCLHGLRHEGAPLLIVRPQRDIEGHHTRDCGPLQIEKPLRRARHHESMQKCFPGFLRCALERVHLARGKQRLKILPGLPYAGARHLQQQMMLEAVPIRPYPARQVLGQQRRERMEAPLQHRSVTAGRLALQLTYPLLQTHQLGQPARAEMANREKDVLAEALGEIESAAMDVLPGDRHTFKSPQDVTSQLRERGRLIRANVENTSFWLPRERIYPHGKHGELAGTTRRLEEPACIRIEAQRQLPARIAHPAYIVVIRAAAAYARRIVDAKVAALEPPKSLLRIVAQIDPEMVHEA